MDTELNSTLDQGINDQEELAPKKNMETLISELNSNVKILLDAHNEKLKNDEIEKIKEQAVLEAKKKSDPITQYKENLKRSLFGSVQ